MTEEPDNKKKRKQRKPFRNSAKLRRILTEPNNKEKHKIWLINNQQRRRE